MPPTRRKLPVFPSLPGVELKGPRASRRGDSLNTKFQPPLRSDFQANKAAASS